LSESCDESLCSVGFCFMAAGGAAACVSLVLFSAGFSAGFDEAEPLDFLDPEPVEDEDSACCLAFPPPVLVAPAVPAPAAVSFALLDPVPDPDAEDDVSDPDCDSEPDSEPDWEPDWDPDPDSDPEPDPEPDPDPDPSELEASELSSELPDFDSSDDIDV